MASLRDPFALNIMVEMAFLLQSTCFDGATNVNYERHHEIGNLISRILGSAISATENQIEFKDVVATIRHLRGGGFDGDSSDSNASNRTCIVREMLLRALLSLLGRICREINDGHSDATNIQSQLYWTANIAVDTLMYKGGNFRINPLSADPPIAGCPQLNTIRLLEKSIIALFVNSTSHAMRKGKNIIYVTFSGCLLRLLHAWCEAFVENLTISVTGHWLLLLLAQEPNIISGKADAHLLLEVKKNLQMLDAILPIPCGQPCLVWWHQEGNDSDSFAHRHVESPTSDAITCCERNYRAYERTSDAVSKLLEWVEKLCVDLNPRVFSRLQSVSTDSLPSSLIHNPLSHFQIQRSSSPIPVSRQFEHYEAAEPYHLVSQYSDQSYWLSPLSEANEKGQLRWSTLVSQRKHLLTVMAPFYWMQLGGCLSHECSVFCDDVSKPAFSHVDAFETESRQRCRRRPAIMWIDDRFVRVSSTSTLGQHLKDHPLTGLMMQRYACTPLRGQARKKCQLTPRAHFHPSSQALFSPPSVALSGKCLGVWPCQLIEISNPAPLNGDLTLDANWIHLVLNNAGPSDFNMEQITCGGTNAPIHGLGCDVDQSEVITCPLHEISRVEERRFELRDLAVELFFEGTCSVPPLMIAFRSTKERNNFVISLVDACALLHPRPRTEWWRVEGGRMTFFTPNSSVRSGRYPMLSLRGLCDALVVPFTTPFIGPAMRSRLLDAQVSWIRGQMSNFDYLMALNTAAGRTYNDLTQYPIFPWVIADFESPILDLTMTSKSFRRLDRPISVQTDARAEAVLRHYADLNTQLFEAENSGDENQRSLLCPAFHYPSFCSNEAIILHFLCRLIPYAFLLIQFQDGNFDAPDRLFNSVASEWAMATNSVAFVKELVPEFYFRPDIFVNWENFALGVRQDGEIVDSVKLPPWAKGDPRLFVLVNRAALESPYVTANLPDWIDLTFGYKQTGRQGERAINLYHPFTYFGAVDVDAIEDPLRRAAVQSMIRNYGQAPRQLFPNHPHPRRIISHYVSTKPGSRKRPDFLGLSRLIGLILAHRGALSTQEADLVQMPQHTLGSPISTIKSPLSGVSEQCPSQNVSVSTSVKPLTAGAPLDTVRGLHWGKWAGNPCSKMLGISWYANLRGGSQTYRLLSTCSDQSLSHWTILVTVASASLFLLQVPSYPLLLVKVSLSPNFISLFARRFVDAAELYATTIPLPFVGEEASAFLVVHSVGTRPLTCSSQLHLIIGTAGGGLFVRTVSTEELLCGFIGSGSGDKHQARHRNLTTSHSLSDTDDDLTEYATADERRLLMNSEFHHHACRQHWSSFLRVSVGWRCLIGHIGVRIVCIASCPQHGLVASGDAQGRVIVWDTASTAFITRLDMDESSDDFMGVCGLAFDQASGDLLVARAGPRGLNEIWIGLFTADCRQSCSRLLDFQAETGFPTSTTFSRIPNPLAALPILFSDSQGCEVGCILIGGPNGCLVWLSSWTLDTVSIMLLDQPSPCPIAALAFAPPSPNRIRPTDFAQSTFHPGKGEQNHMDTTLYIIDSQGWMYFLESGARKPPRRLRPRVNNSCSSLLRQDHPQGDDSLILPGMWL
uniref:BEACH domain-containing protein n=2 Tax=Mesocestoides corti TaxID=53468 RepID=A0A5K3F482_MESCO